MSISLESLRGGGKRIVFLALLATALMPALSAQTAAEYQAKAALLFNFTKFVSWPEEKIAQRNEFVIAVPIASPFRAALESLEGKGMHGRTVRVVFYREAQIPSPCDVAVVDLSTWGQLTEAQRGAFYDRNVLTVGEEEIFTAQVGVLTIFLLDNHLAFDINVDSARAANLTISANLLRLAHSNREESVR